MQLNVVVSGVLGGLLVESMVIMKVTVYGSLRLGLRIIKNEIDLEVMYRDEAKSRRKTITKDAGNMSVEELLSGAEEEAAMASKGCDDDISVTSVVDKGKGPNRVYDVGESHTEIEHEEYMDKLMHQLRDKGDGLTDPFTILENDQSSKKFLIHDEQTHWKIRKPKVGEKYVDAAQLKECLTYYSLANGFSLWFYRSSKEMLIERCGIRPKKLKDIENKGNTF
nr:pentatricopeptide repeat-containing protein [Tanacetum cinerariifolium]